MDGIVLDCVVGRRREATEEFAREFDFQHTTLDLEEGLRRDVDAVVITSPSDMHPDQSQAALRAGKHVLCEIPLATNLMDAERTVQVAQESGRVLMIAHTQRFYPALMEVRRRIQDGELHVYHLVSRWYFYRRENVNWEGKQRSWTDNLLWHHGCHVVDSALWTLGGIAENISGDFGPRRPPLNIPLDLHLQFRVNGTAHSRDPILVTIAMSYNSHIPQMDYQYIGREDTITYSEGKLRSKDNVRDCPNSDAIYDQNIEFVSAIKEGREPSVNGLSVLPAMRILQMVNGHGTHSF